MDELKYDHIRRKQITSARAIWIELNEKSIWAGSWRFTKIDAHASTHTHTHKPHADVFFVE